MADFTLLESSKLLSRKICVIERLGNFHTVLWRGEISFVQIYVVSNYFCPKVLEEGYLDTFVRYLIRNGNQNKTRQ